MKYISSFKRIIFILLAVLLALCSCNSESVDCEELLIYSLDYGIDGYRDNGSIFLKSAEEGSAFFISEKTKKLIYGEGFFDYLEGCEDYAIYTAASNPYEIAIFKCFSRNDTNNILRMCYERADEIKVALRFGRWEGASKDILISECENYIIFLFTDSAQRNENVANGIAKMISNQKSVLIR